MKPQAFAYERAESVDQAVAALVEHGDEAKVLAGGQSLLPMMNFRLARPEVLIDIGGIADLRGWSMSQDTVTIRSLTRHCDIENSDIPGPLGALLRYAAGLVGHVPIRVRGTFGGSLAHSDPSSEWCMMATLLDARMHVMGPSGARVIDARDFFLTVFTPAIEFDEVLTHIELPALGSNYQVNLKEFARRAGDFAIVAVMSAIEVRENVITDARLCAGGVSDRALRLVQAEAALIGQAPTPETFTQAASLASQEVDPNGDLHGSKEFRQDLVKALTKRSLAGSLT